MDPIVVIATRGGVVEATHRVHAVAVQAGAVIAEAGEPGLVTYLRSSAKPLQALPVVRARDDLTEEEVAIACASHLARPEQLAPVRSLLAKAQAAEEELECPPDPTPIEHNCSGKHAGMLALCRARGWASSGYRQAGHAVQDACREEIAGAADVAPEDMPAGLDGCGVQNWALPLERMALAFSRLSELDGGVRVCSAMRAYPDHIRGPRAADSVLMRHASGWTAKGGAEGLMCASGPDGVGIALKVEDGSTRAVAPALAELLRRLGVEVPVLSVVPIDNGFGERVGELRART